MGVNTGLARGTGISKEPRNSPERHHGQVDAMRRLIIRPFYSIALRTSSDDRAIKGPWNYVCLPEPLTVGQPYKQQHLSSRRNQPTPGKPVMLGKNPDL